jgi:toxin-antitoxin system PIN domain toxin
VSRYLLDVNVLIALIDPAHVHHDQAHVWFAKRGRAAWASCPVTQNGVLRIVGHPRYPGSPGAPASVAPLLAELCAMPGHVFWPDDVSLLNRDVCDTSRLLAVGQVTDTYLLALACAHKGQLATLDRRLVVDAACGAERSIHLISAE